MRWLRAVDPWLWPVLLMALIFALSAQRDLSSGLGILDLVGRKVVHAGLYGLLCWLWFRALDAQLSSGRATGSALAISVLYAATDEYHQSFVAGRVGSFLDVAIDTAGALVAAFFVRRSALGARARPRGRREPLPPRDA